MFVIPEDTYVNGTFTCNAFNVPAGAITDAAVASNPTQPIQAPKVQHQQGRTYAQGSATTAASVTQVIHKVHGSAGTIVDFEAGCITPCTGNATISVDLHKNGATVLTAPIALSSAQAARQAVVAVINSATVAAGDVLEIVVTATVGTGTLGQGLFVEFRCNENPQ